MSFIGYRIGGIEQYISVKEATAEETVEKVKEYIEKKIIDLSRIETVYATFNPAEKVEGICAQISCYGDEIVKIYTCITPDSYVDSYAVAQCLELLGIKLSNEEKDGEFETSESGYVNKKYNLR